MGYVTNTRVHPDQPRGRTWANGVQQDALSTGSTLSGLYSSTQETYSYRTVPRSSGMLDADEAALLSAQNQSDVFGQLADEYRRAPRTIDDTGHEFKTQTKRLILTPEYDVRWTSFGYPYRYAGPLFMDSTYTGGTYINGPQGGMNAAYEGPKAVQACIPTHPLMDIAVTLAELRREGFPRLGEELAKHAALGKGLSTGGKTASKEYLAWEFGLRPLLQEYNNLVSMVASVQDKLNQLRRDSGKLIRRSFSFPVTRTSEVQTGYSGGYWNGISNTSYPQNAFTQSWTRYGGFTRTVTTTRRTWFTGAFTYHLQEGDALSDQMARLAQEAQYLTGFQITPEVLWNLLPWSWLSDWNFNIGNNIANASALASDGLVMAWGYLMTENISDHTISTTSPYPELKGLGAVSPTAIYRIHTKERRKASPFGFASNPSSYTARQKALLAALGISKTPG